MPSGKGSPPRWTFAQLVQLATNYKGSALDTGELACLRSVYDKDLKTDPPGSPLQIALSYAVQHKGSALDAGEQAIIWTVYYTQDGTSYADYLAGAQAYKNAFGGGGAPLDDGEEACLTAVFYGVI